MEKASKMTPDPSPDKRIETIEDLREMFKDMGLPPRAIAEIDLKRALEELQKEARIAEANQKPKGE